MTASNRQAEIFHVVQDDKLTGGELTAEVVLTPEGEGCELSVLFIGNSFTQRNDLPGLIEGMAAEVEPPVAFRHERVIANGASLRQHWNAGIAREKIEGGGWTHVVLQEQSTLPIKNAQRYLENVRLFQPMIEAAGARMVLYLTWARKHALETQVALNEAVGAAAEETGALVVPVGPVWRRVAESGEGPELWDKDGSHPSAAGSCLAACVFSKTLFGSAALSCASSLSAGLPKTGLFFGRRPSGPKDGKS